MICGELSLRHLHRTTSPRAVASGMRWKSFVLLGIKREEENNKDDDKKFAVKLNQSGYKPDEIKVQLRGQELTVTVRHITVRPRSNQGCNNYTKPVQT